MSDLAAMLFVPAADLRKLEKIPELAASAFIIDLEDSVAAGVKQQARENAAAAIARYAAHASIWIRCNAATTALFEDDIDAVVQFGLAGIVLPKTESRSDVERLEALLFASERRVGLPVGSTAIIPTVETVAGLDRVDDIAATSTRIACLGFGAGDYSLDLGLDWPSDDGLSPTVVAAKVQIVLASRRAGLAAPHDGVYPNFRDLDAVAVEARHARSLGFGGKHAIHPAQLPVILEVFTPGEAELERSREIVELFEKREGEGVANIHIDGRFIDYPVAQRARQVLSAEKGARRGKAPQALDGITVLDLSNLYAGPLIATYLGDFGADVIKVEHPRGDDARRWGLAKDGVPLWWKTIARNKRLITLDLNKPQDREDVLSLTEHADVLIENYRPGKMESWGLGPADLHARNPRLVIVRVSGFGQTGPNSAEPGFGTLAEAFSGFAHVTGDADGPPVLPPFGLADGVSGLTATYATLAALYWRDARGGEGQVIDVSLFEPLFTILGPQITEFAELGVVQNRQGNRSLRTSPRNGYRTADDRWVAISAGTQQIANRIFAAVGRPELADDPRFSESAGRRANADEIDSIIASWIAERPLREVLTRFKEVEAPIAPVYDASQIFDDPHYRAREAFITCEDADLGTVVLPNIAPRLSRTPGSIRWPGPAPIGADNDAVRREYGLDTPGAAPGENGSPGAARQQDQLLEGDRHTGE